MTEGLKLAGGKALEHLLGQWTSNRRRGLATGIGITALVQSSSAVTVATIGFVNAGLMPFRRAIWVVFGSNVGTTLTAWIVTFFGFTVKLDAYTFPLIGIGAALHIFSPYERGKALGMALAGFGLLFMGIGSLQENFAQHAHDINLDMLASTGFFTTLLALGIGFLLTLLTQSSSAAIAIILTSVAGGISGIEIAAAAAIGANIGTTSTALIATIGATANAKRLAGAHLAFNGISASAALIILPFFLQAVSRVIESSDTQVNLMLMLAIFHTGFNIFGLLIIWPLEPYLTKRLLALFKDDPLSPKTASVHLDPNVAAIPDLAIRAMTLELERVVKATDQLALPTGQITPVHTDNLKTLESQLDVIEEFIALSFKSEITENQASLLTAGLSTCYHFKNAYKTFVNSIAEFEDSKAASPFAAMELEQWFAYVNESTQTFHEPDLQQTQLSMLALQEQYQKVKSKLFKASSNKELTPEVLDQALQAASYSRRFIEQLAQAYTAFQQLSGKGQVFPENKTEQAETKTDTDSETEKQVMEQEASDLKTEDLKETETPAKK